MPVERTAEQFIDLVQRYIRLRPKLILPEHVVQFKKKMEALRAAGGNPEDHAFIFRVLITLSQSPAPLTMSELSTELNVPMSTATRLVDWLVRGDMIERISDPNDRRVVRVSMSKNGRELYQKGMTYNKRRLCQLLKDFSENEQTQLLHLMDKLLNSLSSETAK